MFLGCEASRESRAGWPLGRLTIASTIQPGLARGEAGRGVLYRATRSEAGDLWFLVQRWFRWIPWGLQLAKPSAVKQCCGWCPVLFWF